MTRRIVLAGVAGVAALWSPYIYAELARKPVPAASEEGLPELSAPTQADVRPTPALFGNPSEEPEAEETETAEPTAEAPAPEPEAEHPAEAHEDEAAHEPAAAEPTPAPPTPPPAEAAAHAASTPAPSEAAPSGEAPAAESGDKPTSEAAAAKDEPAAKPIPESETFAAASTRSAAYGQAFERESRDPLWATHEEPRLAHLLQTAGVPVGAFSDVRCQRTVCRVAFNSGAAELADQSDAAQRIRAEFGAGFALGKANTDGISFYLFLLRPGFQVE